MTKTIYNKLVRDKIADIIFAEGKNPKVFVLNKEEFFSALMEKLHEEAIELIETNGDKKKEREELADLYEVLNALRVCLGITEAQLEFDCNKKRNEKGSFHKRLFLYSVEDNK